MIIKRSTIAVLCVSATANEAEIRALINEVNVMKSVGHHDNVIGYIGYCTKPGQG